MLSTVLQAQTSVPTDGRAFGRGLVILKSGERLNAEGLVLTRDTLMFRADATGGVRAHAVSDIEYATRIQTRTVAGALWGGGTMLLLGLAALLQVEADPALEAKDNAGAIIAGFTAGGAVIGAIVGSNIRHETRIIQAGREVVSANISLFPAPAGRGLSMRGGVALRFPAH